MPQIKAIIFDFNGVLLWDTHLHDEAWKKYSNQIRGTQFTNEEMNERVYGRTNKDILEYLTQREIDNDELAKHTNAKETIYRNICLTKTEDFKLSPGAIELLDYLKENKIPFTIATSSEITNMRFFFQYLNLNRWFTIDNIIYDDGTMKGKPAPDLYLKAAAKLNLKPEECLVVEDSRSGIASAYSAKVGEIIALGPKDKHDYLASLAGINQTITDLFELLPLIKNLIPDKI